MSFSFIKACFCFQSVCPVSAFGSPSFCYCDSLYSSNVTVLNQRKTYFKISFSFLQVIFPCSVILTLIWIIFKVHTCFSLYCMKHLRQFKSAKQMKVHIQARKLIIYASRTARMCLEDLFVDFIQLCVYSLLAYIHMGIKSLCINTHKHTWHMMKDPAHRHTKIQQKGKRKKSRKRIRRTCIRNENQI